MRKVSTVGGGEAGTRGAHFRLAESTCTPRLDLAGRRRCCRLQSQLNERAGVMTLR